MEEKIVQFLKSLKRTNDVSLPLLTFPAARRFLRHLKRELRSKTFLRFGISVFTTVFILSGFFQPIPVLAAACATGNNVTISVSCEWAAGTQVYTGTLTINAGVTVTADSNGGAPVEVIVDNLTLNGTITAAGEGSVSMAGAGAGETAGAGGGGALGGNGGGGGAGASTAEGGATHGSPFAPFTIGSGGGDDTDTGGLQGGSGGGAVKIFMTNNGTLTFGSAAVISASGSNATSIDAGGGSGGSIWIDATLGTVTGPTSGRTTISANGGANTATEGGGGGGGGRIALYYTTFNNSGNVVFNAFGGQGGTQSGFQGQRGGAGTVYLKATAATNGDLIIDNGNFTSSFDGNARTTQSTSSTQIFDNVTIRNAAHYAVPSGFTLSATGTLVGGSSANRQPSLTVESGGTYTHAGGTLSLNGLDVTLDGTVGTAVDLTLTNANFTYNTGGAVFSSGVAGRWIEDLTLNSAGQFITASLFPFQVTTAAINSGGILTHATNTSAYAHQLDVSATTSVTVASSGLIDVNGKGFAGGDAAVGSGTGGGAITSNTGSGGGYGGEGGNSTTISGGAGYGSSTSSLMIGSGGGGPTDGDDGGAGGGAVRLIAPTITVNGTVRANGGGTPTLDGGAGAGGTVWIDASSSFTGTGTITANGGAAPTANVGGGGAGGRVIIYYAGSLPTQTRQAFGGAKGTGGGAHNNGGAGTIYLKSTSQTNGDLRVVNNFSIEADLDDTPQQGASETYDNIVISTGARYIIGSGKTLTAVTSIIGGGTKNGYIQIDGTFNLPAASSTLDGLDIDHEASVGVVTSLTVRNGVYDFHADTALFTDGAGNRITSLTLNAGSIFSVANTSKFYVDTATVNSGGVLTHATNTTTTEHVLDLSATTSVTVNSGGSISAFGKGFQGGVNGDGSGPGGGNAASTVGSGGGYGGDGGDSGGSGGVTYGSATSSFQLGSGGAGATDGDDGGAGGGAIRLNAPTVTINSGGTVAVNGGTTPVNDGGGGSGGTVYIDATTLAGTGTITANGAAGDPGDNGGGGGGGRVIIYYSGSLPSQTHQAFGGARGTAVSTHNHGGAGTIYTKSNTQVYGTLTVANNKTSGVDDLDTTAQVGSTSETYDDITISGGAMYRIPGGFTLTSDPAGTLRGGGTRNGIVIIEGTLNPPTAVYTFDGLDVDHRATLGVVTAMTVRNGLYEFSASTTLFTAGAGNRLGSLTLNSGALFSVETTGTFYLDALTVNSGGVMTHATNTTSLSHLLQVSATSSIAINSGGTINVNEKGYSGGTVDQVGFGPGGGTDGGFAGGAGYGGTGGTGGTPGQEYGSVTQPIDIGSGGGGDDTSGDGGDGGGAVKLSVNSGGTISVGGTITALGGSTAVNDEGGGSGGSIWLNAPGGTISGAGTLTANGGTTDSINGGGGGAGGRIAVYGTSIGLSATAYNAAGGATGSQSASTTGDGGAGSIFTKLDAQASGSLVVDNNNIDNGSFTDQISPASQTYDAVTIKEGAKFRILTGFTMTSAASVVGGGTRQPTLQVDGTLNLPASATFNGLNVDHNATMGGVTSLTVLNGVYEMSASNTQFTAGPGNRLVALTLNSGSIFSVETSAKFHIDTLTINSGGVLTHATNTVNELHKLDISATTSVTVASGGSISVTGKGHSAGSGPGNINADGVPSVTAGGGAGYGGKGGGFTSALVGQGGDPYGSVTQPIQIGSGGGNSTGTGGAGGGAIRIIAPTVALTGTVSANGSNAPGTSGGGGSGGSVLIDTDTLSGSGTVSSNGGIDNINGGGGAGGRIAVYFDTNSGTSAFNAFGNTGAGGFTPNDGGAGTVFLDDTNDALANGSLIVDNNNLVSAANTIQTCLPDCNQTYNSITIRNAAEYEIPDGMSLTLASGGTFTGGGTSQSSLIIDNGGTFTPTGATSFTVNDIDVLNSGSFGAVTNLTITASTFTHSGTGTFPATVAAMTLNSSATFNSNSTNHGLAVTALQMNSGTYNSNVTNPGLNLTTLNVGSGTTFNNNNNAYYPLGAGFNDLNVYGTFNHGAINKLFFDDLVVQNGGTMTHTVHTAGTKTFQLDISATSTVYVYTGGTIQANSKGAAAGTGSGILNTNGIPSSIGGGGGSYGGKGGEGINSNSTNGTGGQTFGSVTLPVDIGSGGGNSTGTGGAGGGAIRITAPTATFAGTVSAAGATSPGASGGGGSGGSILIDVTTLLGGGTISSNGGDDSINGGGGSGGRIAIYYDTDSSTSTRTAFGDGTGGGDTPGQGGAGTIFVDDKDDALTNGTLIIDNNSLTNDANTIQVAATSQTFDIVNIRNGGQYEVPSGATLSISSGGVLTGSGATRGTLLVDSGGTFNPGDATKNISGLNITLAGSFATATALTYGTGTFTNTGTFTAGLASLTVNSSGNFIHATTSQLFTGSDLTVENGGTFTQSSSSTLNVTTVLVKSGGTITSSDNSTTHAFGVNISSTTFTVQPGGLVTTDALGFDSTTGNGQGGDGTAGGGAGHGGVGGIGRVSSVAQGVGGVTYSATTTPNMIGSGGGDDTSVGGQQGGSGGGSVILAVSGVFTMNGDISADGQAGTANEGGGGSGGSVWLTLSSWTGSGTSTITATGGTGNGSDTTGGGCGAGGRIYVTYASKTYTGTAPSVAAGTGCTGIRAGQAGSFSEVQSGSAPVNGSVTFNPTTLEVGQNVVVSASATDDTGVASIKIYLDGTAPANLVKTCLFSPVQTPASCQHELGSLTAGSHSVTVVSEDGDTLTDSDTTNFTVAGHTSANRMELSTYKKGAASTFSLSFTLSATSTGTLTVTFPSQFTVNSAATSGSACFSSFGFSATTLTATKTNCSGTVFITGAALTNPSAAGQYTITFTNDNGSGVITIVDDDTFTITASIDPVITFNVGTQTAACDGTFTGSGGVLSLGSLTTSAVGSSDVSSVPHICTRLSTNAPGGAVVTVLSQNASLASNGSPGDTIPSSTALLTAGTTGYGLCVGSQGTHVGRDATTPVGAAPVRSFPFNDLCDTSGNRVGGLTTSAQIVWSVNDPTQNAFARLFIKAAVSSSVITHNDYQDVLTFIATATY